MKRQSTDRLCHLYLVVLTGSATFNCLAKCRFATVKPENSRFSHFWKYWQNNEDQQLAILSAIFTQYCATYSSNIDPILFASRVYYVYVTNLCRFTVLIIFCNFQCKVLLIFLTFVYNINVVRVNVKCVARYRNFLLVQYM